jgi:hypothetical protein
MGCSERLRRIEIKCSAWPGLVRYGPGARGERRGPGMALRFQRFGSGGFRGLSRGSGVVGVAMEADGRPLPLVPCPNIELGRDIVGPAPRRFGEIGAPP